MTTAPTPTTTVSAALTTEFLIASMFDAAGTLSTDDPSLPSLVDYIRRTLKFEEVLPSYNTVGSH